MQYVESSDLLDGGVQIQWHFRVQIRRAGGEQGLWRRCERGHAVPGLPGARIYREQHLERHQHRALGRVVPYEDRWWITMATHTHTLIHILYIQHRVWELKFDTYACNMYTSTVVACCILVSTFITDLILHKYKQEHT